MGLFDGPASVTATAPAQRNSPGQPPAAPPPDTDPIYQAAVQTAIEAERRARGEQSRQHDLINASLQPALDALADQAKQARNTTMSNMEGRGMLRSGETDTRLTGIEQTRLGGENSARTGIANRISDLDAGTQDQLAQIASGKSQAWADAVSRQQQRQQALDDQWNQYVQQLAMQRQQQAWQSQQAELQRQEQERQFQAQLDAAAAAAAAGGGGGGGGGGGRRGGGGGGGGGGGAPDSGGQPDVGGVLGAGAQQGLDIYQLSELEKLLRGGAVDPNTGHITGGLPTATGQQSKRGQPNVR
jgi:hypothetical protein